MATMMNQGRRISTQDASVKTATVDVKVMTLGGKQVTLAVFRQLFDEQIIDYKTLQLRGVPWGRVNYHPDKCVDDPRHMHVVWETGGELRRAQCDLECPDAIFPVSYVIQEALKRMDLWLHFHPLDADTISFDWKRVHAITSGGRAARRYVSMGEKSVSLEPVVPFRGLSAEGKESFLIKHLGEGYDIKEDAEWLSAIASECEEKTVSYRAVIKSLSNIDQLFIAI